MHTEASQPSEYIPLGKAAHYLGPDVNTQAVWRACRKGVLGRNGRRVYLRHRRSGRKLNTTTAWIDAYLHELNQADLQHFATEPSRPEPQASDAIRHQRARRALAAAGFYTVQNPRPPQ